MTGNRESGYGSISADVRRGCTFILVPLLIADNLES